MGKWKEEEGGAKKSPVINVLPFHSSPSIPTSVQLRLGWDRLSKSPSYTMLQKASANLASLLWDNYPRLSFSPLRNIACAKKEEGCLRCCSGEEGGINYKKRFFPFLFPRLVAIYIICCENEWVQPKSAPNPKAVWRRRNRDSCLSGLSPLGGMAERRDR